jgi:hypothetical protein
MNTTAVSPSSIPDPVTTPEKTASSRCPYLYPNGKRCSLPGLPAHSGFCLRHSQESRPVSIPASFQSDSEDLSADLLPDVSQFGSAADIGNFLIRLLSLVTKGRISPRRASVLAFITSQLLHSHRSIILENKAIADRPQEIIFDMPRPNRDWPEPETKPRPENPTYADLRS